MYVHFTVSKNKCRNFGHFSLRSELSKEVPKELVLQGAIEFYCQIFVFLQFHIGSFQASNFACLQLLSHL